MKKPFLLTLFFLLIATGIISAATGSAVFQLRLVEDRPSTNTERMALPIQNKVAETPIVLYVEKAVLLDQRAIKSAKPGKDGLGHPMLDIKFTQSGAKQFAVITRQNINKQIAIIMDGKVCSAPVIRSEILGGSAQISGSFSEQEVKELARKINEAVTMK